MALPLQPPKNSHLPYACMAVWVIVHAIIRKVRKKGPTEGDANLGEPTKKKKGARVVVYVSLFPQIYKARKPNAFNSHDLRRADGTNSEPTHRWCILQQCICHCRRAPCSHLVWQPLRCILTLCTRLLLHALGSGLPIHAQKALDISRKRVTSHLVNYSIKKCIFSMPWVLGPNCKHAGSWSTMRLLRTICVYKRSAATRSAFVFTACRIVEKKS